MTEPNELETQIRNARLTISSDGYPMSIGELTNLYRDDELQIRPEFQRFFRWTTTQKTRLIESVLLGIPLPSIFVAQSEKGSWELVDGLQRVSTILQFQGELKTPSGEVVSPLELESTKYIPALKGRFWTHSDPAKSLTEPQRLDFKRAKIDVKIIKRESSPQAKFDLFHRLNNYGSPLNAAEMRSALLVSASPDFFGWVEELSRYPAFVECIQLSENLIVERFDLELVTRFLVLHNKPKAELTMSQLRDLPQLLDDRMIALASLFPSGSEELAITFKRTFDTILEKGGEVIFRKWNSNKGVFQGSFLLSAFEVFGCGIGYNIANWNEYQEDLLGTVKRFWSLPEMQSGYSTGRSTESRLAEFLPLGRAITAR